MKTARHCAVFVFVVAVCHRINLRRRTRKTYPAYLTALTDLRHARAFVPLSAPSASDRVDNLEQHAIEEIDKAIGEIKHAAIYDGKNLNDHPPVDAQMDRVGRFSPCPGAIETRRIEISPRKKMIRPHPRFA